MTAKKLIVLCQRQIPASSELSTLSTVQDQVEVSDGRPSVGEVVQLHCQGISTTGMVGVYGEDLTVATFKL